MESFSTREVPWMKIGTVVDEAQTAEQAMELAGLDWEVAIRKDGFQTASGSFRVDPSKRKVVRVDTEQPLGTVGPDYQVLQYAEAFDFVNGISPHYVAAGSMKDGKQAFLVVEAPGHDKITALHGEDPHQLYVVLRTSHDGSRAVEVNLLSLRDKCMNMMPLNTFGRDAKQRWSIRHTKNMRVKMEQARSVLVGLDNYATEYDEMAQRLANIEVTLDEAREVIKGTTGEHLKKRDKLVDDIMDVYSGSTTNGFKGTGWGVVNAVTEYHEFFRGGDNRDASTRWLQGLDGATAKAANTAVTLLTR